MLNYQRVSQIFPVPIGPMIASPAEAPAKAPARSAHSARLPDLSSAAGPSYAKCDRVDIVGVKSIVDIVKIEIYMYVYITYIYICIYINSVYVYIYNNMTIYI